MIIRKYGCALLASLTCSIVSAASMTAVMYSTDGQHKNYGTVVFEDTPDGLLITPKLSSMPTGLHGFHLHEHAHCGDMGMDAGGHYDPAKTNSHQGPLGKGHLGDMPILEVISDGKTPKKLLAPRLKTSDLKGLAVMIHKGGDNYTDNPPNGGGGDRIACGTFD